MESSSADGMLEKADWLTRFVAELIDSLAWGFTFAPLTIGVVVGAVAGSGWVLAVGLLFGLLLSAAILVVVAMAYRDGQSVGKRVMGTQVIRADGAPADWAFNFLVRSVLVKGVIIGTIGGLTSGILSLVNYLWPLWDKDRQALHDKMVSTYVVKLR